MYEKGHKICLGVFHKLFSCVTKIYIYDVIVQWQNTCQHLFSVKFKLYENGGKCEKNFIATKNDRGKWKEC